MKILLSGAIGQGNTELAAFDQALTLTGAANFNLIRLSSVIPPNSNIEEVEKITEILGEWGDRLYVVYAEMRTSVPNDEAWAGIGWVQDPIDGRGLFVEHEGHSEHQVRNDITASLEGLMENRGIVGLQINMKVVGGVCTGKPISAFVGAVYQVSDWQNNSYIY